jgi:glycosyltransferase involved in cell wall biosynthesis
MKVAILHDYLNQFGGAERVLETILEIFPDADLYTLLYDREKTFGIFERNLVGTSILNRFSIVKQKHRFFIPLMPIASNLLSSKKEYDLVISSTAGYAKGFHIKGKYHISYCHSPLRYAWEVDYLKNLPFAPWPLKEMIVNPIAKILRKWDIHASTHVNLFITNSKYIQEKVKSYYKREAVVIYPPVDTKIFFPESKKQEREYYLMAGRLLYYKGFDIAIKAFNRLRKPLIIVGNGPEYAKLKSLVKSPLIEFRNSVSDNELRILYSNAKAFIFPQIEDFGLVAAEAQLCGSPIIAFNQGGGAEIVIHKKTGIHFSEQTPEAIERAVREFEALSFDKKAIEKSGERFTKEQFISNFKKIVQASGFKETL